MDNQSLDNQSMREERAEKLSELSDLKNFIYITLKQTSVFTLHVSQTKEKLETTCFVTQI